MPFRYNLTPVETSAVSTPSLFPIKISVSSLSPNNKVFLRLLFRIFLISCIINSEGLPKCNSSFLCVLFSSAEIVEPASRTSPPSTGQVSSIFAAKNLAPFSNALAAISSFS
ncbi:MAG: hypothetical protein ROY99_05985 [Ignavibacterium sp.]|nr:hypothetical protein [Ignavibacterium sp.]